MSRFFIKSNSFVFLVTILTIWYPTFIYEIDVYFSQKIFFALIAVLCLCYLVYSRKIKKLSIAPWFIVFPLIMLLHFLIIESSTELKITEILNVARYPVYLMIASACYTSLVKGHIQDKIFFKLATIVILSQTIFIIIQHLFPEHDLVLLFSNQHLNTYHGARYGGTFDWSYSLCFVLVPVGIFFLSESITKGKFVYLSLYFLALILVFVSQSRVGIVSYVLLSVYTVILLGKLYLFKVRFLSYAIALITLIILILYIGFNLFSESFSYLFDAYQQIKYEKYIRYTARLDQMSNIFHMSGLELVFGGFGSSKMTIENAYGDYLFKYGILGVTIYVLFIGHLILKTFIDFIKNYRKGEVIGNSSVVISVHAMVLSVIPFSLAFSPIDAHKTAVYFFVFLGLYFSTQKSRRIKEV